MRTRNAVGCVATACVLALSGGAIAQSEIVREGAGERRQQLADMERKPLPAEVLTSLESWSTGSLPTTSGKVVVLATWASWYPQSWRVMSMLESIASEHGDEVVIIAIHHERGFERAEQIAKSQRISFPFAHDAKGVARAALMVDQDPDFYVIDRAGQLRFADVATGSVAPAVAQLVKESAEDAQDLNARLAREAAEQRRTERTSTNINSQVDLRTLPEVDFDAPTPKQYEDARWPTMANEQERNRFGDDGPWTITITPADGQFLPRPPVVRGRATLLYFWNPTSTPTYRTLVDRMDRLQRRHGRDLAVISVATRLGDRNNSWNEDVSAIQEQIATAARGLAREARLAHTMMIDVNGGVLEQAQGNSYNRTEGTGSPVAIVSSDGVVRWVGFATDRGFESALEQVLLVDPGVRARKSAEAEYIRRVQRQQPAVQPTPGAGEDEGTPQTVGG